MSGELNWQALGATTPGYKRRGADELNEDACACWSEADGALLVACVADGHGGSEHTRSRVGARLAIEAARAAVRDHAAQLLSSPEKMRVTLHDICSEVVARWRAMVAEDLLLRPLTRAEVEASTHDTRRALTLVLDPLRAYGSTFAMSLVTPEHVVTASLGDASALCVHDDGQIDVLLKHDDLGDVTHSLCVRGAVERFQFARQARASLRLVLLCTDGVSNAFRDEEGFHQLARDLDAMIQAGKVGEDLETLREELPGWLRDFSREGSGDDTALCLLFPTPTCSGPIKQLFEVSSQRMQQGVRGTFSRLTSSIRRLLPRVSRQLDGGEVCDPKSLHEERSL